MRDRDGGGAYEALLVRPCGRIARQRCIGPISNNDHQLPIRLWHYELHKHYASTATATTANEPWADDFAELLPIRHGRL